VKPDVVFGFFGYNESFDTKPEDFKAQLVEFVKYVRGTKPNGKSFPRIVLFSPIAHEDTKQSERADGKEHNAQLEAYTKATEMPRRRRAWRLSISSIPRRIFSKPRRSR
jgi:hypothetical protein